ncbi:MAG: ester cyclase [Actinomycetota bacterium]|nr:ester cyclase [Actinomycetota bacterium]
MAEQVPEVGNVLATIERRDWRRLERMLHPDVHWTTAAEDDLHGPEAVIDRLAKDPPPSPPAYHELADGRLIRWIDTPG